MEHFLAVKFSMGYEKNMSFLVIAKSLKVQKKKVEKIGLGFFMLCFLAHLLEEISTRENWYRHCNKNTQSMYMQSLKLDKLGW